MVARPVLEKKAATSLCQHKDQSHLLLFIHNDHDIKCRGKQSQ